MSDEQSSSTATLRSPDSVRLFGDADLARRRQGPTASAVTAFGVDVRELRRFPGGAGFNWTDGRLVLKPVGCVPEHNWVCAVFAAWDSADVRVPEPVAPRGMLDDWSVDGWGAHVFVPGRDLDLTSELDRVKEASDAFHECLRDLPRPSFMDDRNDPWAYGDRFAWESADPPSDPETLELIEDLLAARRPVTAPEQPIHGDIRPNVLAAADRPLAVIDWPPYYRPAGMANAIAVTDAVTFAGAPLSALDDWQTGDDWDQLLIRALLYRLGPTGLIASRNRLMGSLVTHVERARPVVHAVLSRI
ncbi:aminoglycoside phosphotransferase family protein [Nocardioides sp. HM23]|uniref:aminoglycoside phosphotransferase family protein n=1 Tax=Nocardioides bizhenqiangii TaxID=3095076 RepID=UPI002ACA3543|nr:aminoglycoside phosphotransferase family protein [Nocardioides sp. HM23]MDZ5620111.1 aminoglycoside phosphotransferase family protein [Nocardioides sp. HM23]MDZ5623480.1 aminoglycoside phosphotransferase family protein [Nocardioides sp. HM23]